ncbi:uncharacterized protein LOC118439184 isoform X1 [Folsomia candida]|uniref:uncharacterized protein LOC118439184 isoform X1 n=1 Tax=Folsomia candida TaxID=158441 RepID=UPI001604EC9E|nr:uncharacterized protein LOC118439184 isoform X1 [Folsomia candida]XP_035716173.1 uncharacterized protein LOC118439184 isoform X1 [Folsomia candida]XP_035716174.1 uncharacterized protein LOC118439184 isoform X1 [Folsomia candida]
MCTQTKLEQKFASFTELIDRINLKYEDCKSTIGGGPSNISNGEESTYIEKLVDLASNVYNVQKFLRYLENTVLAVKGGQWIIFCWAYADILHKEKGQLNLAKTCPKVKEFFTLCIQHHVESLLQLHEVMVMIDHTETLGPLEGAIVKKGLKNCPLEEIILTTAKTFSRRKNLAISQIGSAACGSGKLRASIFDFYPQLPVHLKYPAWVGDLEPWQMLMCDCLLYPAGLAKLPAKLAEIVEMPKFVDAPDPSTSIWEILKPMCTRVGPPHESVVGITLLWMYVGVLELRKKFGPMVQARRGLDARVAGLFKIAVARDKYENSEYIINLWNAILRPTSWPEHIPY